jgi:hypothetical protein
VSSNVGSLRNLETPTTATAQQGFQTDGLAEKVQEPMVMTWVTTDHDPDDTVPTKNKAETAHLDSFGVVAVDQRDWYTCMGLWQTQKKRMLWKMQSQQCRSYR